MMSNKRKSRKRTIVDILGEEDYEEMREEIDGQIYKQQEKTRRKALKSASTIRRVRKVAYTGQESLYGDSLSKEIHNHSSSVIDEEKDNESDDMNLPQTFALKPTIFKIEKLTKIGQI